MKTIVLYARSLQCQFYGLTGLRLEQKYNVLYLVQNSNEEAILKRLNCQGKIYNLEKFIFENWKNQDLLSSVHLQEFEDEYDIPSLWQILYTDRFLIEFNFEDVITLMKLHISLFKLIFSENKPDIFVNEEIAIFSAYLMFYFCKKNGAKYIGLSNPRQIGDKKTAIVQSFKNDFYHLDKMYEKNDFSENQLLVAQNFISNFKDNEVIPPYMLKGAFSKKKPKIKDVLRGLTKYFFYKTKTIRKAQYMLYYEHKSALREASQYFKYLRQKRHYSFPDFTEKYYYFPLHYQPEASTLVAAPNYEKQQFAMDLIAKKIPIGTKLYIKEHYTILGHREMSFYKSLKKYPNVKMISPWENSHQLIKQSEGVIVLTGTAGWEGVLYGKPVFVLGNVFYSSFKFANHVENINDLSNILKAHKSKNISQEVYQKELIKYVAAYIYSSKDGVSYLNDDKLLEVQNIDKISKAIESELN